MFVPGKLIQPGLMFVYMVRSLPEDGATERCFTRVGLSLTFRHRLGWTVMGGTNALTYYGHSSITAVKSLITYWPESELKNIHKIVHI